MASLLRAPFESRPIKVLERRSPSPCPWSRPLGRCSCFLLCLSSVDEDTGGPQHGMEHSGTSMPPRRHTPHLLQLRGSGSDAGVCWAD